MLALQRLAGNGAVAGMLRSRSRPIVTVQRSGCGDVCRCGGRCGPQAGEEPEVPVQSHPYVFLQRQEIGTKPCNQLISDDDWKVEGVKLKSGYDTGNYYKDVARVIIESSEQRGVDFDRALFIVAQARGEQGPTDPGPQRFRILNLQVTDEDRKGSKVHSQSGNQTIMVTPAGKKFTYLCSPEDGEVCKTRPRIAPGCAEREKDFNMTETMCLVRSPFYVYDSLEESVNDYIDRMTTKRTYGVGNILLKKEGGEKAGIREFGGALKKVGYGTDARYAEKLCGNYNIVVKDMQQILDQSIATKSKCLEDGQKKLVEAWKKLNEAKAKYERVKADADRRRAESSPRSCAVYADEKEAADQVRKWEGILAELEPQLADLEKKLETLKKRRADLNVVECGGGKAAAPAPTP